MPNIIPGILEFLAKCPHFTSGLLLKSEIFTSCISGEVLIARVGGVAKMAKFREFVSRSKYAKHLVAFWMDAEDLRKTRAKEDKDSAAKRQRMSTKLLRAIQNKYYRTTSRYFLTTKVLGNEMACK